jgi:hypothetical protein
MELTEDFREGVIKIGKLSLEQTARDNEPFMPKMLVEVDGELTALTYPSSFEGLTAVAQFLIDQGKPVNGICLTSDTYHLIAPEGEGIEDASQYAGRLQEEFERGNPMVCEALHLTMVTSDQLVTVSIPYVRKRRGDIVWRDQIVIEQGQNEQSVKGRFPELLQAIIAATNMEAKSD